MAKTSTSFTKLTAPKGKGGAKQSKTKIKEELGLTGWESLCEFIKTDGAGKLQQELLKLDGKDFVNAFSSLIEFVKPKLNRTTVEGEINHNIRKTVIFKLDERFRDIRD